MQHTDPRQHEPQHDEARHDGLGRRHLGWLAVIALALVPFALIDGPGRALFERWGWVDADERFTELYFPDHLALPDAVTPGEPLGFDFSIRNREGAITTYAWRVSVAPASSPSSAATVATGDARLADDEIRVVRVDELVDRFIPADGDGQLVVSVALADRDEAIDFFVTVGGDTAEP